MKITQDKSGKIHMDGEGVKLPKGNILTIDPSITIGSLKNFNFQ